MILTIINAGFSFSAAFEAAGDVNSTHVRRVQQAAPAWLFVLLIVGKCNWLQLLHAGSHLSIKEATGWSFHFSTNAKEAEFCSYSCRTLNESETEVSRQAVTNTQLQVGNGALQITLELRETPTWFCYFVTRSNTLLWVQSQVFPGVWTAVTDFFGRAETRHRSKWPDCWQQKLSFTDNKHVRDPGSEPLISTAEHCFWAASWDCCADARLLLYFLHSLSL